MEKKIVHYKKLFFCEKGKSALVFPADHQSALCSNLKPVLTSMVMTDLGLSGEFETQNSIYRPLPSLH